MKVSGSTPVLVLLLLAAVGPFGAQSRSTHGPSRGSLVLQGGVGFNSAIASAFVARAGGPASHIVVIPTASVGDAGPPGMAVMLARRMKESFGVAAVTVVHTIDRAEADSDSFVEPIRHATGVWLLGGFPPNLVHAYLGTKTERAIKELLERGGCVGGESAGAMIQGSWLDTTDDEWTPEMRTLIRKHRTVAGFALLTNAAIFPHFDKRGPAAAVKESAAHPDQLAIGIDEETALIVHDGLAEVVGSGTVSIYHGSGRGVAGVVTLRNGDRYDLSTRRRTVNRGLNSPMSLLVFDLDGTLIDSRRDLADAANALIVEHGGLPLPVDAITAMVGEGAPLLVRRALKAASVEADLRTTLPRFLELYDERVLVHTQLYDGTRDALDRLASRSVLAILTNKPQHHTERILEGLRIAPLFRWVIGGDTPHGRKPDPAGLNHLVLLANISPGNTIMVGDSPIDLRTARAAGTRLCVVRYGFGFDLTVPELRDGDLVAATPADLPALLGAVS